MINFWWRDAEPPLLTPLNALYHAAITMKDLPPAELSRWRVMFDHYIFGDNGDPAEHLPGGQLGPFEQFGIAPRFLAGLFQRIVGQIHRFAGFVQ